MVDRPFLATILVYTYVLFSYIRVNVAIIVRINTQVEIESQLPVSGGLFA